MIILDIETTGLDPKRHCMLSLGAVDYDSGEEFYGECRVYHDTEIDDIALGINGFTREDIARNKGNNQKHFPHMLYLEFLTWAKHFIPAAPAGMPPLLLAGHNIGHFDILFLEHYHQRFEPEPWLFGYRTLDLHSVAFTILGRSLSHAGICEALGLPTEPKPHHALHGARFERDAFKRLFEMQAEEKMALATLVHQVRNLTK